MNRALLRTLEKITEEEREILKGRQIETERYTTKETLTTIESRKMLEEGRLITVRPHTRFVYFPKHNHNYIEVFYVCKGEVTHIIGKERVTVSAGEILFLNQYVSHEILPSGKEEDVYKRQISGPVRTESASSADRSLTDRQCHP